MIIKKISSNFIPLLALSFSLFLLRSSIPNALFLFTFLQSILIFVALAERKISEILKVMKASTKPLLFQYLVILLMLIAVIVHSYSYRIFGDVVNLLVLISFLVLFILKVGTLKKFYLFTDYFLKSFSILFGFFLLLRFLVLIYNNDLCSFFLTVSNFGHYDRNIYSLNIWLSVISLFYLVSNRTSKNRTIHINLYIYFLLLLVFFSASRRGIVILAFVLLVYFVKYIHSIIIKSDFRRKTRSLFILATLSIVLMFVVIATPAKTRNDIYNNIGGEKSTKTEIGKTMLRYYTFYQSNITMIDFMNLLWGAIDDNYSIDNTKLIDETHKAWELSNNKEELINILEDSLKIKLPKITENNIGFLADICKVPYTYTNFFNYKDIYGFKLTDFQESITDFPFSFKLKNENAHINFVLPALSNSNYALLFRIKAEKSPFDTLLVNQNDNKFIVNSNIKIFEGVYYYEYSFKITDNINNSIPIKLQFVNNNSEFELSDFKWKLLKTNNADSVQKIISDLKDPVINVISEKECYDYNWNYYLEAEDATSTEGYSNRNPEDVVPLLNNSYDNLILKNYDGVSILTKYNKSIITFIKNKRKPRFAIYMPAVQNTTLQIELQYKFINTNNKLIVEAKRSPEIDNVFFSSSVLMDSISESENGVVSRNLLIKIDSLNSAELILNMGVDTSFRNDTLELYSYKVGLYKNDNMEYQMSDVQYNYLVSFNEDLNDTYKHRFSNYQQDSLRLLSKELEKQEYWHLNPEIYKSTFHNRLELWLFGWQYYRSLPLWKQAFGDGFNYLEKYEIKFGSLYKFGATYSPHNPLLSVLLSSGIVGFIIYLIFMFQIFFFYIKYYKLSGVFFIIFLFVFAYSFISGSTHFSIPYFVLFSIIPFLLHYYSKKEEIE